MNQHTDRRASSGADAMPSPAAATRDPELADGAAPPGSADLVPGAGAAAGGDGQASDVAATREPELADGAAPPGSADLVPGAGAAGGGGQAGGVAAKRDPELADGAAPPGSADLDAGVGGAPGGQGPAASAAAARDAGSAAPSPPGPGAEGDDDGPGGRAAVAAVDTALITRRSVRAFLPTPVPRATIEHILAVSSRAPSGTNTQPWKVYVLTGAAKESLTRDLLAAYNDPKARAEAQEEYPYYPNEWVSPYIDRRRKIGWDLYGLLGIDKSDKTGMHEQHARNYRFFGAPVGLMFTIDRVMAQGSWLDYGMFLQSIMVAARARGLDTCPQAAFTQFHRIIMRHLDAPASEMLVCGMSLGHADPEATENALATEREPVERFTRFLE